MTKASVKRIRARATRCSGSYRYRGITKPRCCGGAGCEACWKIYRDGRMRRRVRRVNSLGVGAAC
jgi:hypothetical protein